MHINMSMFHKMHLFILYIYMLCENICILEGIIKDIVAVTYLILALISRIGQV